TSQDVRGAIALLDGATERKVHLVQFWRFGAQPVQGGLGISVSRRDRLHDFVGYRGRQLPHRPDAIDMREFRLRLAQGFRRLCQPRRVSCYSDASVNLWPILQRVYCQSLAVKSATLQKKVPGWRHLQTRTRKVSIEVRDRAFQGVSRFVDRQGLGDDPEAELL